MSDTVGEMGETTQEQGARTLDQLALELAGEALCELELGRANTGDELRMRVRIIDELEARRGEVGDAYHSLVVYDPQFALLVLGHAHERARLQHIALSQTTGVDRALAYAAQQRLEQVSIAYWPLYHLSQDPAQWTAELGAAAGRRSDARDNERVKRINARFPAGSLLR